MVHIRTDCSDLRVGEDPGPPYGGSENSAAAAKDAVKDAFFRKLGADTAAGTEGIPAEETLEGSREHQTGTLPRATFVAPAPPPRTSPIALREAG